MWVERLKSRNIRHWLDRFACVGQACRRLRAASPPDRLAAQSLQPAYSSAAWPLSASHEPQHGSPATLRRRNTSPGAEHGQKGATAGYQRTLRHLPGPLTIDSIIACAAVIVKSLLAGPAEGTDSWTPVGRFRTAFFAPQRLSFKAVTPSGRFPRLNPHSPPTGQAVRPQARRASGSRYKKTRR